MDSILCRGYSAYLGPTPELTDRRCPPAQPFPDLLGM